MSPYPAGVGCEVVRLSQPGGPSSWSAAPGAEGSRPPGVVVHPSGVVRVPHVGRAPHIHLCPPLSLQWGGTFSLRASVSSNPFFLRTKVLLETKPRELSHKSPQRQISQSQEKADINLSGKTILLRAC